MRLNKKKTYPLDVCYSIGKLRMNGSEHILVAAEKKAPCLMFDLDGNYEETVWSSPGGTMSIVPLIGEDGKFLGSQKMYSPDDSILSRIALGERTEEGLWLSKTIADISFAHRFGVLKTSEGSRYLVVSTLKTVHHFEGDWDSPGKFLVAKLPSDIEDASTGLEWELVLDGLFHNHGYCEMRDENGDYSVVSAATGIYEIHPPLKDGDSWQVKTLSYDSTSDMAFVDFDGDGKNEMITISPFHGDTLRIYRQNDDGSYRSEFEFPKRWPFLHSIYAGEIQGKPIAIIGHRGGESRDLLGISFLNGKYVTDILDKDCGSANILYYKNGEKDYLVSANREINEVAFYEIVI